MSESTEQQSAPDPVTETALAVIEKAVPGAVVASELGGRHPYIQIAAEHVPAVCRALKDDASTVMDCCHLISGTDYPDDQELEVLYHLCSYTVKPPAGYAKRALKNDPWICLKVRVPRDKPDVPTVMDLWTGADWHERETFDLVGVNFTGRERLERILLPEDWPGHPLRRDWEFPAEYHGIPIVPPEGM